MNKWIGPNRKDILIYKLKKLKERQLPLLYSNQCVTALENLKIDFEQIEQYVYYKAQLFLPFGNNDIAIEPFNKACINGSYLSYSKIDILKYYQFYIPKKLDWLITPHHNIEWKSFSKIKIQLSAFINQERSPMLWLKSASGELQKCFITFW